MTAVLVHVYVSYIVLTLTCVYSDDRGAGARVCTVMTAVLVHVYVSYIVLTLTCVYSDDRGAGARVR